jgi:hypothetical protein
MKISGIERTIRQADLCSENKKASKDRQVCTHQSLPGFIDFIGSGDALERSFLLS